MKDGGHKYFLAFLSEPTSSTPQMVRLRELGLHCFLDFLSELLTLHVLQYSDPAAFMCVQLDQRTMCLFILAKICDKHPSGQVRGHCSYAYEPLTITVQSTPRLESSVAISVLDIAHTSR